MFALKAVNRSVRLFVTRADTVGIYLHVLLPITENVKQRNDLALEL